jgi:putative flavoprotein involved in K+ transport
MDTSEHYDTIVIGAGQAGLATGYHLARQRQNFVILESHERIGDVWRNRFDSLKLYSPAQYDGLPGMPMPMPRWTWPGKNDMADYLEAYAARFELPVRTGVRVDGLAKAGDDYVVSAGDTLLRASNVVVASGGWQTPVVPDFAGRLDPSIVQMHSSEYRNPTQIQPGPVLVVGCAHSGADIALELAKTHPVYVSGPVRGEIPIDIEGARAHVAAPILWFLANHVLTERTRKGRAMRQHVRGSGGPLLRVKQAHLDDAGVERYEAKTTGVVDGKPELDGGLVLDVANVVWCTGFRKDTSWISLPIQGEDGWPVQKRGAVEGQPGLFFVGLPFQYAFGSMLVGGVGRDAEGVAKQVVRRTRATGRRDWVSA